MQHSCSHSNAICKHRFKKRIELRTQEQQNNHLLQNTEEEPNDPSRNRRTHEVPFHRRPQPLYTEKHKVSCPGFLPTTQSMQHLCSHFPSSPLPILTTSLRHHFPSSPLPFVTTSLGHHCPSSRPCVIASYSFVMYCYGMLSLRPPCVIASYSFVMYCYVMSSLTPPCVIAYYSFVMYCCAMQKTHTTLHQCQISQFYLSVTRKYCFPTSFDNSIKNTSHPIHRNQIEINLSKKIYHWLGLRDSSSQGKMKGNCTTGTAYHLWSLLKSGSFVPGSFLPCSVG